MSCLVRGNKYSFVGQHDLTLGGQASDIFGFLAIFTDDSENQLVTFPQEAIDHQIDNRDLAPSRKIRAVIRASARGHGKPPGIQHCHHRVCAFSDFLSPSLVSYLPRSVAGPGHPHTRTQ
ncbi:hypothetical protein HNR07_001974 [Nocardiopsis metallicus]|uniref:Uncharacterized protein n=1 Tax=Nocardiopsis metallicus TaxID=179819 RepID=A0A840WGJ1_9ACTN|nr:hypothetical protein [Nocardiopsis metallicus]